MFIEPSKSLMKKANEKNMNYSKIAELWSLKSPKALDFDNVFHKYAKAIVNEVASMAYEAT